MLLSVEEFFMQYFMTTVTNTFKTNRQIDKEFGFTSKD